MMKTLKTIAMLGLLALLATPSAALAQRETEMVDRTVAFPSGGTLKLKNFSGSVRITAGSGRDMVLKAWRTARPEVLREERLTINTMGSTIEVNANERDRDRDGRRWNGRDDSRNNVVETRFEIQIPASARLEIDAFSSDVIVTGIEGAQRLKTFSGDIESTGSRGAITANTFSGRIDLDATAQGTTPDVDLETFSGHMRVRLAENARGEVTLDTFSGSIDAGMPLSLRSSGRRNIRAELPGGTGRTLRFKSFSGNVRLVR